MRVRTCVLFQAFCSLKFLWRYAGTPHKDEHEATGDASNDHEDKVPLRVIRDEGYMSDDRSVDFRLKHRECDAVFLLATSSEPLKYLLA